MTNKLEPLQFIIKDGKSKQCTVCHNKLNCSNYWKQNKKYIGREFWCFNCKSKYMYIKSGKTFQLSHVDYRIPDFAVSAHYLHSAHKQQKENFYILPFSREGTYVVWNYGAKVSLDKKLEFPINKEQLEEKATLYTTFS